MQVCVLETLISEIVAAFRRVGITEPKTLREAAASLAFAMATTLDGSRVLYTDDDQMVRPILTFAHFEDDDEDEDEVDPRLLGRCSGTWMHELVHRQVDHFLDSKGADSGAPPGQETPR